MADIPVDQSQYESALRARQLLASLVDDPKRGLEVQQLIKDKFPDAQTPQLDIVRQASSAISAKMEAMEAQNAALQKMIEEDRLARDTDKATVVLKSSLDAARQKYGLTDDGMAKVVEIMQTQNLAHAPEAAAALFAASLPKAPADGGRSLLIAPKLDVYGMQSATAQPDWNQLHASPWDFLTNECVKIHNEFAGLAA